MVWSNMGRIYGLLHSQMHPMVFGADFQFHLVYYNVESTM